MISLVTRHSMAARAAQAVSEALTLAVCDIFGDIFGDLFGGGRRGERSNGPMRGANVRKSIRITFEEAVFGCEKELDLIFGKIHVKHGEQGQNPEHLPKHARNAGAGGRLSYIPVFFGTVQNVQTCPNCGGSGKVIKENVQNAQEADTL